MPQIYDLIQVKENAYYVHCPTNPGIFIRDNGKAVVFDTGNSSNVGKEIRKILDNNGWELDCIINTHAHADHISGNAYLQQRYEVPVFASTIEGALIANTTLLPSIIFGGNPPEKMYNQALFAKPSVVSLLSSSDFPQELQILDLKGHSPDQIGILMPNGIAYLGDALVATEIIEKYHISFVYNLKDYRETLESLKALEAEWYVFAHASPKNDIEQIIKTNLDKTYEIEQVMWESCRHPSTFEDIFSNIAEKYNIVLNFNQFYLTSHTLRSYLTFLFNEEKIQPIYQNGKELWVKV